jgi:hypothetical protein
MKKTLRSLTLLLETLLPIFAMGQVDTGFPAFGTFSKAGEGIDTVNLSNLNVHLSLPLRSLGAGGMRAAVSMEMDSSSSYVGAGIYYAPGLEFVLTTTTGAFAQVLAQADCNQSAGARLRGVVDERHTYHDTPAINIQCGSAVSSLPGSDGWSIQGSVDSNGRLSTTSTDASGNVYVGNIT